MGMGGGSSNQAATVTVRSLALGRIRPGQVLAVIRKEALTGLLVALGTGIVLWLVVRLTSADQPYTALIAALSVFGTICIGTTLGVAVPLVLEKLGADPAVATSPFVSTMNDVLGATIIIVVGLMVL